MRNLGMALTAAVAVSLGRVALASAADSRPAIVVEEPADLAAEPSSVALPDGRSSTRAVVAPPPAAPQPVWPVVLIVASAVGLSVMAVKTR